MPSLISTIPNWKTNGFIFTKLKQLFPDIVWLQNAPANELDVYFLSKFGGRETSPLSDMYMEDGVYTEGAVSYVSNILYGFYSSNWNKLYETLSYDYDPLTPYVMEFHGKDEDTENSSGSNSKTRKYDGSTTVEADTTETVNADNRNDIYGFNSTEGVSSDSQIGNSDTTSDANSNEVVDSTEKDDGEFSAQAEKQKTSDYTRKGNLGFYAPQKMIELQRDSVKWNFYLEVMQNIRDALTSPIYTY